MIVFLTLRCGHNDSAFFIQPFIGQKQVEKVVVFRDSESIRLDKVKYVTNAFPLLGRLNFIIRLFCMLSGRHGKPDVIIGIYEIPHGLISVIAAKLLHKPGIVSIIGNPDYSKLRKGFRMKATMWILRNAHSITVTGNKSKASLVNKDIPPSKIFVLPNTMDFTGFNPSFVEKEYDIVSLGRISYEKRIDLLVKTVFELRKANPGIRAVIGGIGPESDNIKLLIRTLGLEENVRLTGFVPDEELPDFFNKGRVFVLTSETEGFPRTIIQAASCGIPVVASNVGDITDVIDHQVNGILIEQFDNIGEFALQIEFLLKNPSVSEEFAKKLNKKVREKFTANEAAKVWRSILDQIR